ncbi:MAG: hypothetical protein U1F48_09660 [Burkholderiales bacterium]
MKSSIEIPDALLRRAESLAAERGQSLDELIVDLLEVRVATIDGDATIGEPKHMDGFGKLRRLHDETAHIQGVIDEAFEGIEVDPLPNSFRR